MWCDDHGVNDYDICGDDDNTVIVMVCVIIVFFMMMTVFVFIVMMMGPKPYSSPRSLQPCQRLWTLFQQQVPEHELCVFFFRIGQLCFRFVQLCAGSCPNSLDQH